MINDFLKQFIPIEILDTKFLGNSLEQLTIALLIFFIAIIFFRIFRNVVLVKIKKLALKAPTKFFNKLVEAFSKAGEGFYDLVALYFTLSSLTLPERLRTILDALLLTLIILQIISSSQVLIRYFLNKLIDQEDSETEATAANGIMLLINLVLYSLAVLMILSNLGINITSLIASLGIGGIAVALAVQNILADIFSSFSIYFDKPFEIGDTITVNGHTATVERIGIKTTRLRALQGEEIVISNQELTKSNIQNFKKLNKRRVLFSIAVTYNTSLEQCKKIPLIIKEVLEKVDGAELDRATFFEFGDSALRYEIVYYQNTGDFKEYALAREQMNLKIKEEFEKAGIEMAFPTRTLYVKS